MKGKEADLCEALRCLGQALHCLEDFGAHTNYTELALREMGYRDVFSHTGTQTEINVRGQRIFPLVTGTFGEVDFLHSVLGEATDHFAQTEVEQMDIALKTAEDQNKASGDGSRGLSGSGQLTNMMNMLSSIPGTGDLTRQAQSLQEQSAAQERFTRAAENPGGGAMQNIPGTNIDPMKTAAQIYPILEFRDKVVKVINSTIEKIPGLEALVDKITETLTLFVLSLLAPFIRPIIEAVSKQLKAGSGEVIDASGKHQYEPWTDPRCSDPTHSLLSKDHFSNILNEPAGLVASTILQYVAPRVIYAWEHPDIPLEQVLNDVVRVFHHPALRDQHCDLHRDMFSTVERWARSRPDGGSNLNVLLSSDSVRSGKNHTIKESQQSQTHSHGGLPSNIGDFFGSGTQSKTRDSPWEQVGRMREMSGTAPSETSMEPQPGGHPGNAQYGYSAPPNTQAPQQPSYGQPPYAQEYAQPQGYGAGYSGPPQEYAPYGPPQSGNQNYGGYGQQPAQYAYGGNPPYPNDPNAPRPPQSYGPGGAPPPPGSYYGGPSY